VKKELMEVQKKCVPIERYDLLEPKAPINQMKTTPKNVSQN